MRQYFCVACQQLTSVHDDEEERWVAGHPVCPTCETKLRNRSYPGWLKLSFAALVGLAAFSFAWNWRFVAALREMRQISRAMTAGDIQKAAEFAERAARHLPEHPEMAAAADMYRGIALLSQHESAKAVEYLKKAKESPGHRELPQIDRFLLEAEAMTAFDSKNYDEFLVKSQGDR